MISSGSIQERALNKIVYKYIYIQTKFPRIYKRNTETRIVFASVIFNRSSKFDAHTIYVGSVRRVSDRYRMKTVAVEVSCDRLVEFVWTRSIFGDSAWHLCRWSRLVRSTDAETRYHRPCSSPFLLPPRRRRRSDSPPGLRFDLAKHSREFAESITKRLLYGSHFSSYNRRRRIEFRVSIPWKDRKFSKGIFYTWEKTEKNSLGFYWIFFLNSLW